MESLGPMRLVAEVEQWPRARPARITGYSFDVTEVLAVRLEARGQAGRGEGAGIYYTSDRPAAMLSQLQAGRATIEAGLTRADLQALLPAGGARNALDAALWDLEAKITGQPAWRRAGLEEVRPLVTTLTCHADAPERMAQQAASLVEEGAKAIKLKLTGEEIDGDRVRAVREAAPQVWLSIDANQGFSRPLLEAFLPTLVEAKVALVEQPFPIGQDALLDGFQSPIDIAADESAQILSDIPRLVGRYDVVNIKLDKCGGLTEALEMARSARAHGLKVMVGNMGGTSLAMAPALLVGQLCDIVDLDGPTFLKSDREIGVSYEGGFVHFPEGLWG